MSCLLNFYTELNAYLLTTGLDVPIAEPGCTDAEIEETEKEWGVQFPESYRLFLKWCGKGTMEWMGGQDFTADSLDYSWECAITLLAENNETLASRDFVISQWQGYNFFAIQLGADNPLVTLYVIKSDNPDVRGLNRIEYGRLTDWIIQQIKIMTELRHELGRINADVPAVWGELDRIALLATE
ncbi:SMI1/KNR4 family protein [Hymenobacter rigui]|uniref:SMI1/KNR4 family protein n=1 Tax=Hymenobacter rigui TaxID=334424 RepID=A0A428KS06_9BACT|nr:SMI1/KNR4 family protein [Hymenobacter rigui]RSK49287.1 SMI1/KNR4 family protein [Hymenobacter rigui]